MKKKRYPTYRRKTKKKKQLMKKVLTAIVLCVVLALSNGWIPPRSIKEAKEQGQIFGEVLFSYIEENASILWEDTVEAVSDAISDTWKNSEDTISLAQIPKYSGNPYVELDGNVPEFSDEKKNGPAYEFYSELDSLERCGYAEAKITTELMPTQERGAIGMVKPTGWHTVKYDNVDGRYLYNRCHLIGYQLTGENANRKNLITGTRYLNVTGMLPFENEVADYVRNTGNPCMYRVTPVFEGDDLVAKGVEMEAESVKDSEISFHVFVYNVQPGIGIDYSTGNSWKE